MNSGGREILPRGLVEVSNICAKDCLYCGIRRSNARCRRYHLTVDETLACCDEALRRGYPAVAFQAGEIESEANTRFYEEVLRRLDPRLEVTLSLGEQTDDVYRRWKAAGGGRTMRYLLRIETSNRELYGKIHPAACSFDRRVGCLLALKRLGYVTGSGVIIGLPGQTREDLARDLDFFEEMGLDMVGMGPYVAHPDTPLGALALKGGPGVWKPGDALAAALGMIGEVRRRMPGVNIVAATALDALDPEHGRERGLAAGANVIMPVLTPPAHGPDYALYPGKTASR